MIMSSWWLEKLEGGRSRCIPCHQLPSFCCWGEIVFAIIFLMELILRVSAYGCQFFTGPDRAWNLFDTLLITSQALEQGRLGLLKEWTCEWHDDDDDDDASQNSSFHDSLIQIHSSYFHDWHVSCRNGYYVDICHWQGLPLPLFSEVVVCRFGLWTVKFEMSVSHVISLQRIETVSVLG